MMRSRLAAALAACAVFASTATAGEQTVRVKRLAFSPAPLYEDPDLVTQIGEITEEEFGSYKRVRVAQTGPQLTLLILFDETRSAWINPFYVDVDTEMTTIGPCNILIVGHDPAGVRSIGEHCKPGDGR